MKTEEEKKEIARLRTKAWRLANKEKANAYGRMHNEIYREIEKDGLFTVYYLPKENYVGMTTSLCQRLRAHKSVNHNRDITGYKILGKYATKEEAVEVEASYHAKGYLGRNPNYKKLQ